MLLKELSQNEILRGGQRRQFLFCSGFATLQPRLLPGSPIYTHMTKRSQETDRTLKTLTSLAASLLGFL